VSIEGAKIEERLRVLQGKQTASGSSGSRRKEEQTVNRNQLSGFRNQQAERANKSPLPPEGDRFGMLARQAINSTNPANSMNP